MGGERLTQEEHLGAAAGRGSSTATREQEHGLPEDQGRRVQGWGGIRPSDAGAGSGGWAQPREEAGAQTPGHTVEPPRGCLPHWLSTTPCAGARLRHTQGRIGGRGRGRRRGRPGYTRRDERRERRRKEHTW
jgi:hypothetical protein